MGVLIEESEADPENAIYLNSYIPHKLAKFSNIINSKLIHISTDCVFSGDKKNPYTETDEKDGRSIYSKTKSLGEVIDKKNLTLRTSVVGPELNDNGEELFHWFMKQSDCISGYTKAIWSGITTLELAKAVKWAIDNELTGLYHVTNNKKISKYDLLKLFQKFTKKNIEIKQVDGIDIDRSFIDTRLLLNYEIPSYEQMICDMVNNIASNKALYSQYRVESFDKK
jgi:dTDP-4-dehydrorhamnose reductase